jgi:hypothetical protein
VGVSERAARPKKDEGDREPTAATSAIAKASASVGIIAAMVLAVLVNVFVSRHFKRWDWTRGGLYTLSDATLHTLRSLEEPIHVYVLLSAGDPLTVSVRHMLEAYRAETTRLVVDFTDPDRRAAEFLAVQQRYGVVAGKTDDGRIVTDASIIVVRGDKPFFITSRDLVQVDDADDARAKPRLEQALTGAIRSVIAKDQPVACFSAGHGERSPDAGGATGASVFKERLTKNNFLVRAINPVKKEAPEEKNAIDACRIFIMVGPAERIPPEDAARLKAYIERGGSVLLALEQQPDPGRQKYMNLGLDDVLGALGLKLDENFIFELDPAMRSTGDHGETFAPNLKPHAITEGLLKLKPLRDLPVIMKYGSSLSRTNAGNALTIPLLETSDQAFGMVDFFAWANQNPLPAPTPATTDKKGPLTVGYAVELPKPSGSTATHGPRAVVLGSSSVIQNASFQHEQLRGMAVFVESSVAWLAARPPLLDIPDKPAFSTALHMDEAYVSGVFRKVLLYMPATTILLGVAVYLRRRGEDRRRARASSKKAA